MKKIFAGFFCLLFIVPALFIRPVVAATPIPTPIPSPDPVEYILPYPGILPTHPLYMFKTLRDKIIEMLIADPVSKAEFYTLQADKKLNMGLSLTRAKNPKEAASVFAEALASRGQAVSILESHGKSGNAIPGYLIEKLTLSLAKHAEVLKEIGESQEAVEALRTRVMQMSLGEK